MLTGSDSSGGKCCIRECDTYSRCEGPQISSYGKWLGAVLDVSVYDRDRYGCVVVHREAYERTG